MENTETVTVPVHYNPHQLVTYKSINGTDISFPTIKVTELETMLDDVRRYRDKVNGQDQRKRFERDRDRILYSSAFHRLAGAADAVFVHAAVIDALLEIDAHGAERGQVTVPLVARVDVVGIHLAQIAGDVVHGSAPSSPIIVAAHPAGSGGL